MFSPKLNKCVAQSADLADPGATTATDVPGLAVTLPRAGTYHVTAVLPYTAAATSKTQGAGLAFSGSSTSCDAWMFLDQPGGVVAGMQQTTMGTLATATSRTSTSGRISIHAVVRVTTSGILKLQVSRSTGTIAHTGGVMTVREG